MQLTTVDGARRTYAFSRGAAELFGDPVPYFVGFGPELGSLDPSHRRLLVSAAVGSAKLKVGLADEADAFAAQDLVQLDSLPLWPVAMLEPSEPSHRLAMELFLESLPEPIRNSTVQIPPDGNVSGAVDDAMRWHSDALVEHSARTDRALVRLRQLHEETQRAFRELEQVVLQNTKFDSDRGRRKGWSPTATGLPVWKSSCRPSRQPNGHGRTPVGYGFDIGLLPV